MHLGPRTCLKADPARNETSSSSVHGLNSEHFLVVILCYVFTSYYKVKRSINIQIVTGIEVNSESYFLKLREYCPSAEGTRAIFLQLREIRLTIDR